MKKHIIAVLVLFSTLWLVNPAFGTILVGRIDYVEGQIYRFMDVDQSWVETYVQSPAGTLDVLITGENSRAEIVFPNETMVRLDQRAEIVIQNLDEDESVFTLQTGRARFYNRSAANSLVVDTVMGTVQVGPGAAVDVQADENSIVVWAVHGETTFQSTRNGVERLEVLSGATSLEFREESIIAGSGPLNREWDTWCIDRENIWNRNRLVRSPYLPETMQEYAVVLEPNGSWDRIYYRGYYYWAWKPRYVAVGWSPYTTGYWSDWHGSSVWIDTYPWGWVTHHHGHWIQAQGAWLWTPYIHVSYVPGVTVIGFNISYGKTFRPYWHPGRVRWISHEDYIGWLPLAPWETYYGYRSWGGRTVVVNKGPSYSIGVNLAQQRHLDHAVIIPKRYFQQRGPGTIKNYNTVRVGNIKKTKIVKEYKLVSMLESQRGSMYGTSITGTGKKERRAVGAGYGERKPVRKENVWNEKPGSRAEPARQVQMKEAGSRPRVDSRQPVAREAAGGTGLRGITSSQERTANRTMVQSGKKPGQTQNVWNEKPGSRVEPARQVQMKETGARHRVDSRQPVGREAAGGRGLRGITSSAAKTPKAPASSQQQTATPRVVNQGNRNAARGSFTKETAQNPRASTVKSREERESRPGSTSAPVNNIGVRAPGKNTAASRQNGRAERKQVQQKTVMRQELVEQNQARSRETLRGNNKNAENDRREAAQQEKQTAGVRQSGSRSSSREQRGSRQGADRDDLSASLNNRRSR